jgi:hypothetical protein
MPKSTTPKSAAVQAAVTSPPQKLFNTIAQEFSSDQAGVVRSQMMGMPCLKVRGKMFAGFWREAMVFKLAGESHKNALALKGTHLFDPSDMNRPMKEWVVVPYAFKSKWRTFTQNALDYVALKT